MSARLVLWLVAATACAATRHPSNDGQSHAPYTRPQTLDAAVTALVGEYTSQWKRAEAAFDRAMPTRATVYWLRRQASLPRLSIEYLDVAFLLAYRGVRYRRNLQRVLWPYRVWRRMMDTDKDMPAAEQRYVLGAEGDGALDDVSPMLASLYMRTHDRRTLANLLELRLDGDDGEAQAGDIDGIWRVEPSSVLGAASGNAAALLNVAAALELWEYPTARGRPRALGELRRFSHDKSAATRHAARYVYRVLAHTPLGD